MKSETYLDALNIYGYIPILSEVSIQIIKNSCISIVKELPNDDVQSSDVLINECINFKELMKVEEIYHRDVHIV